MTLYERALAQIYISTEDAKRFDATQLQNLMVSDSINGSKPKSLFRVEESIAERVRLQGNVISHSDYNQITPAQKQALIRKGIYPVADAATILTNMPYITRNQFDKMSPGDKQSFMLNRIPIRDDEEVTELNIPNLIASLQIQDIPKEDQEDVKED